MVGQEGLSQECKDGMGALVKFGLRGGGGGGGRADGDVDQKNCTNLPETS